MDTSNNPQQPVIVDPYAIDLSSYTAIKPRLDKLVGAFEAERTVTVSRREVRNIDVSVEEERMKGNLDMTDTFVPIRVIDTNIRREQPPFIAFLKQSKRLMSFNDVTNPTNNTTDIENEFTRIMTYSKWEIPHFKCLDSAQTHGWGWIEVVFDTTKPGHVSLDYIAHEDLIFPLDSEDHQGNEILLRRFSISILKLKQFVTDFGFDPVQVSLVTESKKDLRADESIVVYKCLYKQAGVVYVGWYSKEYSQDWLKAPAQLFLGISEQSTPSMPIQPGSPLQQQPPQWTDTPIEQYPIFLLPYTETEQKKIVDYKGRVFLDKHKQEAMTCGWSSFLSAQNMASGLYGSLNRDSTGGQAKLESVKLQHGKLISEGITLFHPDYPDPSMLTALQALDTQNSQETGQTAFAVKNRQDSRKTATEIQASKEDTALLSSVQVTLYSTFIREIYSLVWRIVQSQALQDKIVFLFDASLGSNNHDEISKVYELHAAGDTDVIRRAELLEEYKDLLPLLQGTSIYDEVLAEIVKLTLSDKGSILADKLSAGNPSSIIASLLSVLKGAISPQEQATLAPGEINSLKTIINEGVSYLQRVGYQPPKTTSPNSNVQPTGGSKQGISGSSGATQQPPTTGG